VTPSALFNKPTEHPMSQSFDASKSLTTLEQDNTVIAVIEMSQSKWLVAAVVPGVKRQPLKKLQADEEALLKLLYRWRTEAGQTGREIKRVVVAYEAGRDGFWLARWLRTRGVEAYVIHPASIAVSREHRRAKTDRLDTELLMRAFLGWLRGEKRHCSMAAVPAAEEEDARRPNRERENLVTERTRIANQMKAILARFGIRSFKPTLRKAAEKLDGLRTAEGTPLLENTRAELSRHLARLRVVREQIRAIEQKRLHKLAVAPAEENGPHVMVRLIARVFGVGVETADMLVNEVFARHLRDRKAVARYAGLTGSPDESGKRRRERGLARAGNARVRRGMIQLAWCFIRFQKDSALAKWFDLRTADGRGSTRKTMIVALARKLLIALWRLVTTGGQPHWRSILAGLPMTIRGGGDPTLLHGFRAAMKNGPAASELRRDAHDCIMVPILTDRPNTRMRAIFAPDGELPSELSSFALTAAKLTRPT
jgi:transposase